jgi:hypothetical protein
MYSIQSRKSFKLFRDENQHISDPLLPYSITSLEVSIDSITLTWSYNKSATFIDKFELTYQSYISSIGDTMVIDGRNATTVITIDNLTSGEPYGLKIEKKFYL